MTNARTTLTLGTILKAANGTSHEVVAILDRVVYARLPDNIRGTAYAWDKDGNSLSLNSQWDLPDLANYYVPEMWSLENLPKVKADNGYTYMVAAQTADEENRVVYCNLGANPEGGLYAWDFDGNALWAHKDPNWSIAGMGDVLDLYLDALDAFEGVDWTDRNGGPARMALTYDSIGWAPLVLAPTEEDLARTRAENTPERDNVGIPEGCMCHGFYDETEEEGLPALEALSDYLSVLMDGKLDGEEILTQIITAYHADEDR